MAANRTLHTIALAALCLTGALAGCKDDRREERLRAAGPNPSLEKLLKVADANIGASKFSQCAACHRTTPGSPDLGGPNLYGVYGQPMGQTSQRFGYTAALRNAGGVWDAPTLDRWMVNPQAVVPATAMQFAGVPDALDRADIIAYLRSQSPTPKQ